MAELVRRGTPVGRLLKDRKETVAVGESSAGGLLSACLLAVPGASVYYRGGAVVYTVQARDGLLAIPELPKGVRSSSEAWALILAREVRRRMDATWGTAETGAAGPSGNRYGDAAGHSCIAVAGPIERAETLETGSDDREANMWRFTDAALDLLLRSLKEAG